jgi:hypothetical protein
MAGLERRHNDRVEDINVDVFQKWVTESKSPVTWEEFVKTLRKAGLNHLAVLVESGLTSYNWKNCVRPCNTKPQTNFLCG